MTKKRGCVRILNALKINNTIFIFHIWYAIVRRTVFLRAIDFSMSRAHANARYRLLGHRRWAVIYRFFFKCLSRHRAFALIVSYCYYRFLWFISSKTDPTFAYTRTYTHTHTHQPLRYQPNTKDQYAMGRCIKESSSAKHSNRVKYRNTRWLCFMAHFKLATVNIDGIHFSRALPTR